MENGLFRKRSLERIASPEQLTGYIRVTSPNVWIVLTAIAVLLIAVLIWSVFGALTDTLQVQVLVSDGAVCYVNGDIAQRLSAGMPVRLGEADGILREVAARPLSSSELREALPDDYTFSLLSAGVWSYAVILDVSGLPDGLYEAQITLESIRPIVFLWN
ncbi:MAG TPA: hypothetical protein PKE04_15180 [Clostridia bacterium]|nr:hypothetical protein [Clostridia bacterium]